MRSTYAYLSSGSSSALNSSTPASRAMRSAVRSESPVSITTCLTPSACRSAMASRTPGLSGSSMPSTPTTVPSTARYSGDKPCIWDSMRSLMSDSMAAHTASMRLARIDTRKRFGSAAASPRRPGGCGTGSHHRPIPYGLPRVRGMVGQGWVHIQQIRAVGQQVVGGPHA